MPVVRRFMNNVKKQVCKAQDAAEHLETSASEQEPESIISPGRK